MATIARFQDILAWKRARALTAEVYVHSRRGQFSRDFALRDQIRRSCVSIMSNIAEGFERGGNKEFLQFLYVAMGSAAETQSHLYVAFDQSYLTKAQAQQLSALVGETKKLLGGLINYLKTTELHGRKSARHYRNKRNENWKL